MEKYYLTDTHELAMFNQQADSFFWDAHWGEFSAQEVLQTKRSSIFSGCIERHLPDGGRILEAGCGRGNVLAALLNSGYDAIGIDIAERTLSQLGAAADSPLLGVANVQYLPFKDNTFDGYVSGGVIEHFWDGYEDILLEAYRVLRAGGYCFLTFPCMSWLRKGKAWVGGYPRSSRSELNEMKDFFYQYALDREKVRRQVRGLGFIECEIGAFDGIKGFKDEIALGRSFLQHLYDSKSSNDSIRRFLDRGLRAFAPHMARLVLRK